MPQAEPDQPCSLRLFWDEAVTAYDFGPGHPMDPTRLALTMRLVEAFDLPAAPGVTVTAAPPAGESTLHLVHRLDYIERSARPGSSPARWTSGTVWAPRTTRPSPRSTPPRH